MRPFAKPTSLAVLSLEARVLYTAFIALLLAGIWSAAWLSHDDGIALSPVRASAYYRGGAAEAARPTTTGGPALDLPAEERAGDGQMVVEKSARSVIETFHFHMFSVPVCLLIVGHLFMMCRWSTRSKVLVLVLGAVATTAHLFGPLLVRFGPEALSSALAWMFVASAIAMAALWTLMLTVPLVEMWRQHTPFASPAE